MKSLRKSKINSFEPTLHFLLHRHLMYNHLLLCKWWMDSYLLMQPLRIKTNVLHPSLLTANNKEEVLVNLAVIREVCLLVKEIQRKARMKVASYIG